MTRNDAPGPGKAAVSIKDMAALVGLSRQRFMQLVKAGVFPPPDRDEASGRPYYTAEAQAVCLDVRKKNVGVNGRIVMFYARRPSVPTPTVRPNRTKATRTSKPTAAPHDDIVAGLHALGLTTAGTGAVADAVADLFPGGTGGVDRGEVIRAVFLHLRGKNTAENVGSKE